MECPKNCAKIGHAIFGEVVRYEKANLGENVHLRISLCEMQKVHSDAVYAAEKICQSLRSLNLRVATERGKIFMAMYHFRIKSDKKPNGTKISAVKHVEYIDREGSFAHDEQWKENNKFEGDCITTSETSNALGGLNALLYKTDDFGSIRNTERGLEVTENASLTTISIALMLADEAMGHKPLIISGSPVFRKKVLETAVLSNLSISFQDNLLQNEFEQQKEDEENERNSFVANEGKIISKRPNIKPA